MDAWKAGGDERKVAAAKEIMRVGKLMTATEIRSTKRYWHVTQNDENKRIYPSAYKQNVIGILWSTMAQFGTWFGSAPYLPFGIQLLPLTAISEDRDSLSWAKEIYHPFSTACAADFICTLSGWSLLQLGILATVGHADVALDRIEELPKEVYTSAGGNGQSQSNTLWYLATRPVVADPPALNKYDIRGHDEQRPIPTYVLTDCHVPKNCTKEVLDTPAGDYSCRERMQWLITAKGNTQWEACADVAGIDHPDVCGPCNPNTHHDDAPASGTPGNEEAQQCPPCTQEECVSDYNQCPSLKDTFVCTQGSGRGGCKEVPWDLTGLNCRSCCELTKCLPKNDNEAKKIATDFSDASAQCPPCGRSVCYGQLNQCPIHNAPYVCTKGTSLGGCSAKPWLISADASTCSECCELKVDC
jgi:hypothetical protein